MSKFIFSSALISALVILPVKADIIGGSDLLDNTSFSTLQQWLGQGDIDITNIFTKQSGSTSADFHTAADGKGATFAVMEITDGNRTEIVGGYNPLSWNSSTYFNYSFTDASRTAFIFNLTTNTLLNQKLNSQERWSEGDYQTLNRIDIGPSFGGGADLWVSQNLNSGYSYQYSYGSKIFSVNNFYGSELTTISTVSNPTYFPRFSIGRLEVFTVAAASVPEPSSLVLLMSGILTFAGFGLFGRKKGTI